MQPFKYSRASNVQTAVKSAAGSGRVFLAGGTNLLDLMKEGIESATELIDVTGLPLSQIRSAGRVLAIGAMAKNSDTANHPLVRRNFPVLSQAILAGASAQIRNMATNGGNLMQRTRCTYFYDVTMPCNKRSAGSGCGAMEGINKGHAIFGWSDKCVATNPSDMSVALLALDAVVKVLGPNRKERSIAFADFHRLPGDMPERDNNLEPGELITAIEIPLKSGNMAANSYYLKVRDRASYAFALVSVAAAFEIKNGAVAKARVALGSVSHKPWRALEAEKLITGKSVRDLNEEVLTAAANSELKDAKPLEHNGYKVELARRAMVLAFKRALKSEVAA